MGFIYFIEIPPCFYCIKKAKTRMPIGLAGCCVGACVSLIQLFPSPSPSPAPFGVPTHPTPPQAAGLGWVIEC